MFVLFLRGGKTIVTLFYYPDTDRHKVTAMRKSFEKKKFNTTIVFEKEMIAPCGMNCGSCLGFMRNENHCPGCRSDADNKPSYCSDCIVINCDLLKETESKFCYECPKYPCRRLKDLDKRYRTRYGMSMLENLGRIRTSGIRRFVQDEKIRWTCRACGSVLCVHRGFCLKCKETRKGFPRSA